MKKVALIITAVGIILLGGSYVIASVPADHKHGGSEIVSHGGGLDQYGCHNDHQRGGYHCHR